MGEFNSLWTNLVPMPQFTDSINQSKILKLLKLPPSKRSEPHKVQLVSYSLPHIQCSTLVQSSTRYLTRNRSRHRRINLRPLFQVKENRGLSIKAIKSANRAQNNLFYTSVRHFKWKHVNIFRKQSIKRANSLFSLNICFFSLTCLPERNGHVMVLPLISILAEWSCCRSHADL